MQLKVFLTLIAGMFFASALSAQLAVVPPPLDQENVLNLDLTTGGRVTIQLRPDVAPLHVDRIKTLARRGFYDGLSFHRVIEGFMAQAGDPKGDGSGGSELPDLNAEFNWLPHVRGAVSAARTDLPNSANSQFFIMLAPRLTLDHNYTTFGRVVSGMNFVDAIERGEPPAQPTRIIRASIGADNIAAPPPGTPPPTPAAPIIAPPAATPLAAPTPTPPAATPLAAPTPTPPASVPPVAAQTPSETPAAATEPTATPEQGPPPQQ